MNQAPTKKLPFPILALIRSLLFFVVLGYAQLAGAASLNLTPTTGVYTVGGTFTMQVVVNTQGKTINAADGTITYNPNQLQVVSVSRGASIFTLWTAEPTFSNTSGQISFSGGLPSGFSGADGNVLSVTFRVLTAGTARVAVVNGSVLAADGMGTNVLTTMGNSTFTLSAASTQPPAEVIVEFVPPANTPVAPIIQSSTHSDPTQWYQNNRAVLRWNVPSGVTGVRTLLNDRPSSVPTRVYESPISEITLDDLPNGVSYFHIQFRNADGWGRITSYRLAVDTVAPQDFSVARSTAVDETNPEQLLVATSTASVNDAPLVRFLVQINGQAPQEILDSEATGIIRLPRLEPGYYTISIEGFDAAGNSAVTSLAFSINAFEKPVFVSVPERILTDTIPVFQGTSRPESSVQVSIKALIGGEQTYTAIADAAGQFRVIPDQSFQAGVYEMTAVATDSSGAQSDVSDTIRFVVETPGYVAIGSMLINILSTFVTLIALLALLGLIGFYLYLSAQRLRRKVSREAIEVQDVLNAQFDQLIAVLEEQAVELGHSRKGGKLSKGEAELVEYFAQHLTQSRDQIAKEVSDVIGLVNKK